MPPNPPIYKPAPPWKHPRSRYVPLYHGCTSVDAIDIIANGIDLSKCRVDTDFGRGFYTTTVRYQARQWAWTRFYHPAVIRARPNQPVVLRFLVDRHELADYLSISFVLGGYRKTRF